MLLIPPNANNNLWTVILDRYGAKFSHNPLLKGVVDKRLSGGDNFRHNAWRHNSRTRLLGVCLTFNLNCRQETTRALVLLFSSRVKRFDNVLSQKIRNSSTKIFRNRHLDFNWNELLAWNSQLYWISSGAIKQIFFHIF